MLARIVSITRYVLGGFGLYIALSQVSNDVTHAVAIASLFAVGLVGTLSFVSHVFLHSQDAKQIGLKTDAVSFQFEVGFANLALGAVALISYAANWSLQANTVIVLAYALYLLQAALLHLYTAAKNNKTRRTNLIRGILSVVFSGSMLYIAWAAITSTQF